MPRQDPTTRNQGMGGWELGGKNGGKKEKINFVEQMCHFL